MDVIVNTRVYIVKPLQIRDEFEEEAHLDMTDLVGKTKSSGKVVAVYPHHEEVVDVGQKRLYLNHMNL